MQRPWSGPHRLALGLLVRQGARGEIFNYLTWYTGEADNISPASQLQCPVVIKTPTVEVGCTETFPCLEPVQQGTTGGVAGWSQVLQTVRSPDKETVWCLFSPLFLTAAVLCQAVILPANRIKATH